MDEEEGDVPKISINEIARHRTVVIYVTTNARSIETNIDRRWPQRIDTRSAAKASAIPSASIPKTDTAVVALLQLESGECVVHLGDEKMERDTNN